MSLGREIWRRIVRSPAYRPAGRHGARIINDDPICGIGDEEAILMRARIARSRDDAQVVMRLYPGLSARQIIDLTPRRRSRTFHERVIAFIRRMEGHYPHDLTGTPYDERAIRPQYRYRPKK